MERRLRYGRKNEKHSMALEFWNTYNSGLGIRIYS
jgi:hypothetical protein